MTRIIAALSVDKVQTCLFEAIRGHEQEKQTEEHTLRNIRNSSTEISCGFIQKVQRTFEGFGSEEIEDLLKCSGIYVFACCIPMADLEERLNGLFLDYYYESRGQKLLRYVCFEAGGYNDIAAIQEAKKRLKQARYFNPIIERNRDKLFSFQSRRPDSPRDGTGDEEYPMFVKDINGLYKAERAENGNRFWIAVVKADLDGMGSLFGGINDYEEYKKISGVLNDCVSLKGLHEAAKDAEACSPEGLKEGSGWLFPFYIAGDDIFFAVAAADMLRGVDVCRRLAARINEEIKKINKGYKLTVSIGAEPTFNREPIRYYLETVERQLKSAKSKLCPKELEKFLKAKISIGGLTFFDIDYEEFKEYKNSLGKRCEEKTALNRAVDNIPVWRFFLRDVGRLAYIRSREELRDSLGTHSFFHSLLDKLSHESVQKDETKYMNQLLYHLLPQYLSSPQPELRSLELLLNAGIIRQMYARKDKEQGREVEQPSGKKRQMHADGANGMEIQFNAKTRRRLEAYLRLMLLLTDNRFSAKNDAGYAFSEDELKNAAKLLLTKIPPYLFNKINEINKDLGGYFVRKASFTKEKENKRQISISYYQRLRVEKGLFFRLHDTEKVPVEKAAELLSIYNAPAEGKSGGEKKEVAAKTEPVYRLPFDKDCFISKAKKNGAWKTDFIDSLMLFYQYVDMTIEYKRNFGKKKEADNNVRADKIPY